MSRKPLKHHLYVIIFGTHTPAGRAFDISLIVAILASLLVLILESIPNVMTEWSQELRYIEYSFTALFTVEYLLRLYCSPKPKSYATSFYGVVDLLAILPTYLAIIFPGASFMGVVRLLRVMRIFRILKLVRYLQDSNILLRSLLMARRKILIFFSTVGILVVIFGALIFVIEGPENGFTSIPHSIYWAIVTITTVGYGDMVPQTAIGKAIASLTMLLGYSILAVPTGIITAELSNEMNSHKELVKCPNCNRAGHDSDAIYCKHCASELADPDKRVVSDKE
ncbi:putative Potassium voltage-gated channel subfamily KQT; potassium channel, VIC family [Vibrio chagasii]|uniref:ion transporter n=1 Tax=Vibrio TaxID=662 RepID=UPI000E325A45|nr:ion transporter [Vibrio splendidus]CAH6803790.1 putative Potassium voltage-gated channel subfamily KQT; potassium channel, VIC family [Vibrio chagasii]CAH6806949.1 putative Potassium voltage-gated channel subfamily KQT; potassium channel, VIC family [Vibrio chagasii]CAH6807399.1 putative Potassium voltage-gated channel subfamily KQT; potassium channel, VIC family [Vibrio chagasii]CAH6811859.1 putative Potassium voltage-gated channel subfamily KQT; potassium channel, VIC family [Vibrio chagas